MLASEQSLHENGSRLSLSFQSFFGLHLVNHFDAQCGEFAGQESALAIGRFNLRHGTAAGTAVFMTRDGLGATRSISTHINVIGRSKTHGLEVFRESADRLGCVGLSNLTTFQADGCRGAIRSDTRAIIQSKRGSMSKKGVLFHFAHALSTLIGTTIQWLLGQLSTRTPIASCDLVENHMLETLLEARADKPRTIHDFARHAIDHGLFRALALTQEFFKGPLGGNILKRTGIDKIRQDKTQRTVQHFKKLCNCHATVDAMQIDNGIGTHSLVGTVHNLRQIFFIHQAADDALLSMPIRNLVADGGHSHGPQAHAHLKETIAIHHDGNLVDDKGLGVFANDNDRTVATDLATRIITGVLDTTNENVIVLDARALGRQTVFVDLGLIRFAANANARHSKRFIERTLKGFVVGPNFTNDGLVHLLDRRASAATFNGTAIANDRIFL